MKKILIVEDDQKIAFALCVRLKAQGYAALMAGDGITAINMAVRDRPDLIIMDISLPAGNGFMLAERLRELPETRATPVIFATASHDPDLRKKAIDLGAMGLLRKPYDAESLLVLVKHALGPCDHVAPAASLNLSGQSLEKTKPRPKRILIVEDDEKVALALAVRMRAAGFHTTVANDAVSGLQSAVSSTPDAVVLDISLSAGDGFSVAEGIQANISTPLPIFFLTASKRPEFRQRARQLGATAFFEKPYEARVLVAAINRALA